MRICNVQVPSGSRVERAGRDDDLAVMSPGLLEPFPRFGFLALHGACLQPPLVSQLLPSSNVGLLTAGCGITLPACRVHAPRPLLTRGDALVPSGLLANGYPGLGSRRNGYALGW